MTADPLVRLVASAAIGFAVTSVVIALALKSRRLRAAMADHPNDRSLHRSVTPRFGGLAMLAGLFAGLLATDATVMLAPLGAGYLALAVVSAYDDRRGLPAWLRLLVHLVVAALFLTTRDLPPIALVVLTLAFAWAMNLYNFMDGADGLAGGMAVSGFLAYGIAAWTGGDPPLSQACFVLAACAMAFLRFNFAPARIFLGDSGSIPLGFAMAGLGLHGQQAGLWSPLFPMIVFFPFVFDATLTLVSRLRRGHRPWQAHREHLYQRAVLSGLGHRAMSLRAYALMAICLAAGLLSLNFPIWSQTVIITCQLAAGVALSGRIAGALDNKGTSV